LAYQIRNFFLKKISRGEKLRVAVRKLQAVTGGARYTTTAFRTLTIKYDQ
jgi:hypothetical protein